MDLDALFTMLQNILMVVAPEDLCEAEATAVYVVLSGALRRRTWPHIDPWESPHHKLALALQAITPQDLRARDVLSLIGLLSPVSERLESTPAAVS